MDHSFWMPIGCETLRLTIVRDHCPISPVKCDAKFGVSHVDHLWNVVSNDVGMATGRGLIGNLSSLIEFLRCTPTLMRLAW